MLEYVIALLVALSFHEAAHAFVANALGDPTAKHEGRITLNPLKHLDLVGTVMFIFFHIGWGKPVPYNPNNLDNPKIGGLLIGLAGPLSNFVIAIISALLLKFVIPILVPSLMGFFYILILINLALGIFNFLPFEPLDGAKIFTAMIPDKYWHITQEWLKNGPYILIGILFCEYILNIPILSGIIYFFLRLFMTAFGFSF